MSSLRSVCGVFRIGRVAIIFESWFLWWKVISSFFAMMKEILVTTIPVSTPPGPTLYFLKIMNGL